MKTPIESDASRVFSNRFIGNSFTLPHDALEMSSSVAPLFFPSGDTARHSLD
jgi:hypothetical protein